MSDIHCAVCGEPWDSYGARHGDMAPWEYRLFRQGAGCPCCEGNAPAEHIDEHLRSVVMNDEDPDSFALLHAPDATRPKWARPPDQVLFECAGCGARLERDIDLNTDAPADLAVSWRNVPAVNAFASRDWPVDASDSELQTIGGKRYCPGCAKACDECGKPIFSSQQSATGKILYGDTYDEGASFADPRSVHGNGICIGCMEAIPACASCGEPLGDDEEANDSGYGECCREDGEEEENANP